MKHIKTFEKYNNTNDKVVESTAALLGQVAAPLELFKIYKLNYQINS